MKKLVLKIADLFLETDTSTKDWKDNIPLKRAWYIFFIAVFSIGIVKMIPIILIRELENSITLTSAYRITRLIIITIVIIALMNLVFRYYKYVLNENVKLYFVNIIWFYLLSILVFGSAYYQMFKLDSSNYIYSINLIDPSQNYINLGWKTFVNTGYFILYSCLESVPSGYNGITSNSIIVSVYNYIQNVFTIGLISLLIATFVRKNTK